METKKQIGLIVNPVAGMGGRVGLKGSDGVEILRKAIELGARPEAPNRAVVALEVISKIKEEVDVLTFSGDMGENELIRAGFEPIVIGHVHSTHQTTSQDTIAAARKMLEHHVDLLLFAGGDGTARDIYQAVKNRLVTLGIPAGVKIHSGVYAMNPVSAGIVAVQYLKEQGSSVIEAEVMDLDEEEYRHERISPKLYGYLKIPHNEQRVQGRKARSQSQETTLDFIASDIINNMEDDVYYFIGAGTTTRRIMEILRLNNTLIGVDVVKNKKLVASDVTEEDIWNIVKENKSRIVVTAIGGQGHIFGRGSQQFSPRIIRKVGKDSITVIATMAKMLSLPGRTLIVDTGDIALDEELSGYMRVVTGLNERVICKIGMCLL